MVERRVRRVLVEEREAAEEGWGVGSGAGAERSIRSCLARGEGFWRTRFGRETKGDEGDVGGERCLKWMKR